MNLMFPGAITYALSFVIIGFFAASVVAQTPPAKPPPPRVEPGLENAVKWKWRAVPSDPKNWGLELPEVRPLASAAPPAAVAQPESQYAVYEVKRGDALFLIGKRFGVTVDEIKRANALSGDLIRVGQVLKIPPAARAEVAATPKSTNARLRTRPSPRNLQVPGRRRS